MLVNILKLKYNRSIHLSNFKRYNEIMGSSGSMLISLIGGVFFLVILSVGSIVLLSRYTQIGVNPLNNKKENVSITDPIDRATSVSIKAELKSIQVGLEVYYAEIGAYPNSLQDLSSGGYLNQGVNISNYNYQLCDSTGSKALLYNNSSPYPVIILVFNGQQSVQGDSPPICT